MKNKLKISLISALIVLGFLFIGGTAFATTETFNYTAASSTWIVPTGVTSVTITAVGANGGAAWGAGYRGLGGVATGTLAVSPGTTYYLFVAGSSTDNTGTAGIPGGGGGYEGGGGLTWFSTNSTFSTTTVIIVGAGGGGGPTSSRGGAGGGLVGSPGTDPDVGANSGGGGTQTAGGYGGGAVGDGTAGQGGTQPEDLGGGGGAGYYGGGAGYNTSYALPKRAAGGGGSSYVKSTMTATSTTSGVQLGNGYLTFTYTAAPPTVPKMQVIWFFSMLKNMFKIVLNKYDFNIF